MGASIAVFIIRFGLDMAKKWPPTVKGVNEKKKPSSIILYLGLQPMFALSRHMQNLTHVQHPCL
jgi:formylmethanofuran dehydrogenase subunit B